MSFSRCFLSSFLLVILVTLQLSAQGLTPDVLSTLRASFKPDPSTTVMMNTITANSVKTMALDRKQAITSNSYYSHRIKTEGITDQKSSGRCWLYAGLNMMRPLAMTSLKKKGFEFSQTYLFFYDKLEKANLFLESIIQTRTRPVDDRDVEWLLKNPFPDGGQWNMVLSLIDKYGAVPSDIMPETESSGNTNLMNQLISTRLRKNATAIRSMHAGGKTEADIRTAKIDMLKGVYRMLALHLGAPPETFVWRYEDSDGKVTDPVSYTPKEFYKKFVDFSPEEYVVLYSVPTHDFNKLYQIRYDRNCFDKPNMTFVNLPIQRLKEYTLKSVLANDPVWYGCDVGKESDSKLGVMKRGLYDFESIYGVDLSMTKKERVEYQESVPSHAMLIIGVDVVNGVPEKWLVENSWGTKAGNNGLFTMYDSWFDEYTFTVIINKKYLPKDVLAIFAQQAEELPPWDPMFTPME